ncbi:hypothetical protein BT96DRAFT_972785 [Gymnopus androsaceus JB14]|uniref:Protein kinase domain-containing protein n=1 Tax=Gymnopus androsaceus JB14 TaxID=1447944 RepID=A0A6A4I791_9AGAR|nr:hypothetical protein BT96DRAFT_972785 [Gymnopus androsaceus JB14]
MLSFHYISLLIIGSLTLTAYAAPPPLSLSNLELREELGMPWIDVKFDNPQILEGKDKKTFSKKLSGITIDEKLPVEPHNSYGLYTLKGRYKFRTASKYIMKIMLPIDNDAKAAEAFGEVKALKIVGDLVDSGLFTDLARGFENAPVIIMKKKSGEVLSTTTAFKAAVAGKDVALQTQMKSEALKLMCAEVARIAYKKKVLHDDNHENNVLVTLRGNTVISVELVDWGPQGTYQINKKLVTQAEIEHWCIDGWKNEWK